MVIIPLFHCELIQNARDAIIARRILEGFSNNWGRITVRIISENETHWLEVEDNGIGMSESVLTGPMLDFEQSYWDSGLAIREWPGLISSQFQPTGKYGIGFYSVFMIGEYVKIVTRRDKDGKDETRVLEFTNGIEKRPILRPATSSEQRNATGTLIRIQLNAKPSDTGGILGPMRIECSHLDTIYRDVPWQLRDLCEWLCPALDVDLVTEEYDNTQIAIRANDWETLSADMLVRRLALHGNPVDGFWNAEPLKSCLQNLTNITDNQSHIIARTFLWPKLEMKISVQQGINFTHNKVQMNLGNVITAGQFRGTTSMGTIGLWLGRSCQVSRSTSEPIAFDYPLKCIEWASQQADLINSLNLDFSDKLRAAEQIRGIGANTGPLPIAIGKNGLLNFSDITSMRNLPKEIILFSADHRWHEKRFKEIDCGERLNENTFGVLNNRMESDFFHGIQEDPKKRAKHPAWNCYFRSLWGAVIEAIAFAWNADLQNVLEESSILAWNPKLFKRIEISNIKIPKRENFSAVVGVDSNGNDLNYDEVDIIRKP